MKRWFLTVVACLCFLLTVAVVALWVRSRWVSDAYAYSDAQGDTRYVASYAGGVHVHHVKHTAGSPPSGSGWVHEAMTAKHRWEDRYSGLGTPIQWSAAGFGVVSGSTTSTLLLTVPNTGTTFQTSTRTMGWTPVNGSGTLTLSGNATITSGITTTLTPSTNVSTATGGGGGTVAVNNGANAGSVSSSIAPTVISAGTIMITNARNFPTDHHLAVVAPYWFLAFFGGLISCFFLVKSRGAWRQRRRQRMGLCRKCGYDLRASSGRCPECGEEIEGSSVPLAGSVAA